MQRAAIRYTQPPCPPETKFSFERTAMSRRRFTPCARTAAVAALLLGAPAAAQSPWGPLPGTIEVGAFGQWTWFDENAGRLNAVPKDGPGFGGRLGVFFTPRLQLEGDGWYSQQ